MRKYFLMAAVVIFLTACNNAGENTNDNTDSNHVSSENTIDTVKAKQELNAIADEIHSLFKTKDMQFVDKHMAKDGIYMGTDPNEIWSFDELRNYVERGFKDTAMKISDYTISRRHIDVHRTSAVIVDQYMLPEITNKVMIRSIGHARYENGKWMFDLYSWNLVPKNEDLSKISNAL